MTGAGFTAAERTGPAQSKVVTKFDPTAEATLFIPRLKGGADDVQPLRSVAEMVSCSTAGRWSLTTRIFGAKSESRSSAPMAFA